MNQKIKSIMIALEGIDGAGKSSQVTSLAKLLHNSQFSVATFRYTGSMPGVPGDWIKHLYKNGIPKDKISQLISKSRLMQETLFAWQAHQNLRILKSKQNVQVILCDRSAVTAFIAHAGKTQHQLVWENFIGWIEKPFIPDYVIFLDISVDIALDRLSGRANCCNDEHREKIAEMRSGYIKLISGDWKPDALRKIKKWIPIDGCKPIAQVQEDISQAFHRILIMEGVQQ